MKKLISVVLALALVICSVFALAGCSKKGDSKYEMVLITDGASINDGSYNQSAWNGLKEYCDENSVTYRYYQPNLNEEGELETQTISDYIDLAVKNGAKYIVLSGENFAVSAYEIAPTYSDVNFLLVDALPHSQENNTARLQSNVMCVNYDVLQAGFLAGYTSVIDGNKKLGYLGSVKDEKSGGYGAGFAQGAAYAADQLGIPVTLDYADYDSALLDYDYSFTIEPVYKKVSESKEKTFTVKVVDGIGSGTYTDGENVTITANQAPENKVFDHWEVKSNTKGVKDKKVNISSKKESTMNLLVGDCDCTITAVWADAKTYPVTVTEADGKTENNVINATENSSVTITAPAAQPGMIFNHWDSADDSVIEDVNAKQTKVNVSDKAITVVPVYIASENPTFNVTVKNGTGTGNYVPGDYVSLVADAPEEGYMFYKWENIDNQGLSTGIAMENEYCYTTGFEMVDRYASIAEKMYDDGVSMIFGGGNPKSDSIFTATKNFDYQVFAFGSGTDQGGMDNCYASVVNDYGAAVKQCLGAFKGGTIFSANCSSECIYVTGKNTQEYQLDEDGNPAKDDKGNKIVNKDYNKQYASVYKALADGKINLTVVQSGGDIRKAVNSKCLTLNYWVIEQK